MKTREKIKALMRSPYLFYNILLRGRYDFDFDLMHISLRNMSFRKRLNLIQSGGNLLHRRLSPWSMPIHMQVELTSFCNARCPVCPVGEHTLTRPAESLDPQLFETFMQQVSPYLLTLALWAWGEPLLHPQLAEILRIAHQYDVVTFLSTNGELLNKDSVQQALLAYPPTYLIVAIDGLTQETNARYRVGVHLDRVLAGVNRLAERKAASQQRLPILHMRTIAMQHNEHEIPSAPEFARKHGFDLLTIRALSIIDAPDEKQVHQQMKPTVKELNAYEFENNQRLKRSDFICQQPFWYPTMYVDGTIVGCEQDYNALQPMGKLDSTTSFRQIWNSPQAARVRQTIRDHPDRLSFCRNCPFRDHQATSCSIKRFVLNPQVNP